MKVPESQLEAIRYFADEDRCIGFVAAMRWPNGVVCPSCGRSDVSYLGKQKRWQCKSAHSKRQFSAKTGTIFEDSALGLDKWLPAVWNVVNAKNGISSYEMARNLRITQKSAWHMNHRIREAMKVDSIEKLSGTIEADETYVGGKTHDNLGRFHNKTAAVGIVEKKADGGQARAFATKTPDASNTLPFLRANIEKGSTLHTDEGAIYYRVQRDFEHFAVNHSKKEYVRDGVHINTVEGLWNLFKRSYKGTYTHLSAEHLDRYMQEHVFRYNTCTEDDGERFVGWFKGLERCLTYKTLTGHQQKTVIPF
jgi:transposase-like protein